MSRRWNNVSDLGDAGGDPERMAIVDLRDARKPRTYTYAEFDAHISGVAALLIASGLRRGAHVAIASLNRAEFLFAFYGIQRAGMVAVPINIKLPREQIDYILADAAIAFGFVDAASRPDLAG